MGINCCSLCPQHGHLRHESQTWGMECSGTIRKIPPRGLRHREEVRAPRLQARHLPERLGRGQAQPRRQLQGAHHPGVLARVRGGLCGQEGRGHRVGSDRPRGHLHPVKAARGRGRGHNLGNVSRLVQVQ